MTDHDRQTRFTRHALRFMTLVDHEASRATAKHPPLNSHHEAYAVILEELDEYKAEVWKQTKDRDPAAMRTELVQLAAMCLRAAVDLNLMDAPYPLYTNPALYTDRSDEE